MEKVHLLLAIVLLIYIKIQTLWKSRGQGNLVILAKGHMSVICQHFQTSSPLKLQDQFYLNFYMRPPSKRGKESLCICSRPHDQDGHIW